VVVVPPAVPPATVVVPPATVVVPPVADVPPIALLPLAEDENVRVLRRACVRPRAKACDGRATVVDSGSVVSTRGTFHVGTLQRHYKKISDPLEEISDQKGRKSLPEGRKFQLFGNL
jgi:hypothetical protein